MLKQKSVKAIIISLLIVLSTTCFSLLFASAYQTLTKSSNNAEVAAWSGSGTQSNPYLISSKSDFTSLASNVNSGTSYSGKYFQLTADINFGNAEFSGVGSGSVTDTSGGDKYQFAGIFDGNGFEIKNFKLYF